MDQRGVTLVEMLITITVGITLIAALYLSINVIQKHTTGIERKVTAQMDVKPPLNVMAIEISMASFNPTFTTDIWLSPTTCAISSNQRYRGIQEATANTIAVEMDANENGSIGDSNEVIRYEYLIQNEYITRSTNCGSPQPFLGDNPSSGRPRTVRVINRRLGIPVFRYFDGNGIEIFPSESDQSMIPNIRRIHITLAVETEEIDPTTNRRKQLIYSTSVLVRNHAISY
ncbi:MAG: prepilin-type N-terminal cleavage/methylation domain-containing protein [Syntrophales bacterium]|nr:prepilin-type N-terminal cleavage/methylation domain-containing protein [Syntrophales bacterium]